VIYAKDEYLRAVAIVCLLLGALIIGLLFCIAICKAIVLMIAPMPIIMFFIGVLFLMAAYFASHSITGEKLPGGDNE